jgi:hypothetical protein
MMYRYEKVQAKAGELSPILRGLAREMIRRGEQFDHGIPLAEALESDLEAQLRLALSEPALRQEWVGFFQAVADAAREDVEAIRRGEHDHEL